MNIRPLLPLYCRPPPPSTWQDGVPRETRIGSLLRRDARVRGSIDEGREGSELMGKHYLDGRLMTVATGEQTERGQHDRRPREQRQRDADRHELRIGTRRRRSVRCQARHAANDAHLYNNSTIEPFSLYKLHSVFLYKYITLQYN